MAARDPLSLLRAGDPAGQLPPLSDLRRIALLERAMTADPRTVPARRSRTLRTRAPQVAFAFALALVLSTGIAWAAGALSPVALFSNSPQQEGAAPGALWDQQVIPESVRQVTAVELPTVGKVEFWYGRSRQGGWCGALRLANGSWLGTGDDPLDAGGTVPGCFPTRDMVNRASTEPVFVINAFDYEQSDVDARSRGGAFWRINYGRISATRAVRVVDLGSGREATVAAGGLFELAVPDPHPDSAPPAANGLHLVAYGRDGTVVADACANCPKH
jgi:hypothetical protein